MTETKNHTNPDGSPDEIGRGKALEGQQQPVHARHAPDPLAQLVAPQLHQSLTGMPASRAWLLTRLRKRRMAGLSQS